MRLRSAIAATADAETFHALGVVVVNSPHRKDNLRDTGAVNCLKKKTLISWILPDRGRGYGGRDVGGCFQRERSNLHNGLVKRVGTAVMDRADDIASSKDRNGLRLNPIHNADAIMSKFGTKDLGNAAGRLIHRVATSLLELPENLKAAFLSLAVENVHHILQRLGHLNSLIHGNLDDRSYVDVDGSSMGKPFSQLGIRLLKGLAATDDRATRDDVVGDHEGKVQLWKGSDQDLDALRAVLQKIQGSAKNSMGSQVRLHLLALRVILNGLGSIAGEMNIEHDLAPWHGILKTREEPGWFR